MLNYILQINLLWQKKLSLPIEQKSKLKKLLLKVTLKNILEFSVKGGGCSGFKYSFTFDKTKNKDDVLFDKAVIDKTSLDIISGSIIDFKVEMIGESFVINNPKASSSCGCGLSFSV